MESRINWLRFAALICVVTVLQAGMVNKIAVTDLNIKPDFLLILLVFFAVYCDSQEAIIASFTIGFAADIISSSMGPGVISFGLFGTLLANLHRVIVIRKMAYQGIAIFITGLITGVSAYLLSLLKGQPPIHHLFLVVFWISVYSAVVGPFLFLPTAWWMRIRTHRLSRH